jgi:hypothetical protein
MLAARHAGQAAQKGDGVRRAATVLIGIAAIVAACGGGLGSTDQRAAVGGSATQAPGALTVDSPPDGSTVPTGTVIVVGTAAAGAHVVRDIPLAPDTAVDAGANGAWAMSVNLEPGSNTLTFRIGNDKATAVTITVIYQPQGEPTPTATPSSTATPEPTPTPSPTPTPEPTPPPTPSPTVKPTPTPAPVSYATLTSRSWAQLVKAPDNYLFDTYVVWACITQFDAATGEDAFRGDASYRNEKGSFWLNGENSLFAGDADQLAPFVEGDIVVMNVTVLGSYTYDTSIGGSLTVPSFLVDKITRKGSC